MIWRLGKVLLVTDGKRADPSSVRRARTPIGASGLSSMLLLWSFCVFVYFSHRLGCSRVLKLIKVNCLICPTAVIYYKGFFFFLGSLKFVYDLFWVGGWNVPLLTFASIIYTHVGWDTGSKDLNWCEWKFHKKKLSRQKNWDLTLRWMRNH
jgi:hypothetical protein